MTTPDRPAPRLVLPDWRWQSSVLDAARAFHAEGRLTDLPRTRVRDHFPDLLASWECTRHPMHPREPLARRPICPASAYPYGCHAEERSISRRSGFRYQTIRLLYPPTQRDASAAASA